MSTLPAGVGVLEPYVRAGVFGPAEVHLAHMLVRLAAREDREAGRDPRPLDDDVVLAAAVAARAPRSGHVCVQLDQVDRIVVERRDVDELADLHWPAADEWAATLAASPVVASAVSAPQAPLRPLVLDGRRLYLHRLHADEVHVAEQLRVRAAAQDGAQQVGAQQDGAPQDVVGDPAAALASVFGTDPMSDRQHQAAARALDGRVAVVVGGPGTGKTRTVARLLAAALVERPGLQLALCAPTGKAAARMTDAVQQAVRQLQQEATVPTPVLERLAVVEAGTLHRLLGRRRGGGVRHDRGTPLPQDLVVVDETSMVDLPLMAQLLDALRPDASLVLVGDPDQLASVEAGTVLADLATPDASVLSDRVVELTVAHRFAAGSGIADLADAVRRGDTEQVLAQLGSERDDLVLVRPDDDTALATLRGRVVESATQVVRSARDGRVADALAAARGLKVLCATRMGPLGLYDWTERIEHDVAEVVPDLRGGRRWEVGRPFMVTRNDPVARVANGDTGVVVDLHGRRVLAIDTGAANPVPVPVARLDQVEPWWAMTIHKSQGSEFDEVVVSLPTQDSPVLTRELLYTAVTRARRRVTVVADEVTLRRAVERPVSRASGLRDRLAR